MADPITAWLTWLRHNKGRSETTCDKYRGYLVRLQEFLAAGDQQLLTAGREQLEEFTGIHAHKQGLSPRSRRALVAAVRGFYHWARRAHLVDENPADAIPYPKSGQPLPVAMDLASAEKLLMAPDIHTFTGIRDAAILAILIGCTTRVSGLVRLNESDLTFARVGKRDRMFVRLVEKGGKERHVPAPQEARLLVQAYLGHPDLEQIDRTLKNGDRVLFVSTRNRQISPHEYHGEDRRISVRSVQDLIWKYGEQAGIPENQRHAHAARHLYGAELAESDVDLLERQALLGHADPKTTAIYTQLAMRKLVTVVDKANPLGKIRTPVTDLVRELDP